MSLLCEEIRSCALSISEKITWRMIKYEMIRLKSYPASFSDKNLFRYVFQLSKDNILKQNIGVSPAFLSEIKPSSAGANNISYNLTTDMIDSIFRTYPMGEPDICIYISYFI